MAVFCLARDLADLEARLGRIVVAENRDRKPVTLADLKATGAMTVLLKDARSSPTSSRPSRAARR